MWLNLRQFSSFCWHFNYSIQNKMLLLNNKLPIISLECRFIKVGAMAHNLFDYLIIFSLLYLLIHFLAFCYQSHQSLPHVLIKALLPDSFECFCPFFQANFIWHPQKMEKNTSELYISGSRIFVKQTFWLLSVCVPRLTFVFAQMTGTCCAYVISCSKDKYRLSLTDTISISFIYEFFAITTHIYINKHSFLWFVIFYSHLLL